MYGREPLSASLVESGRWVVVKAGDQSLHIARIDPGRLIVRVRGQRLVPHGAVKVAGAGGGDESCGAFRSQTTADGDLDATAGETNEMCEMIGTAVDIGRATRGEDAPATGTDNVFKRLGERGCAVEGAMEGDLKGRGQVDQLAGALDVDFAIGVQNAECEPTDAERFTVEEIFTNETELEVGVDEVAAPRTQQHIHGEAAGLHGAMNEGMSGCKAVNVQVGAELDACRAAFPGDQTGLKTFGAELKDDVLNGRKHVMSLSEECRNAHRGAEPLKV